MIIRDKATQESKGSAFVWYTTRAQAERAILEFNLRHVLPDATGQHDRPLVVRRAKSRSKGLGGPSTSIHPAMAMLTQVGELGSGSLVSFQHQHRSSHGHTRELNLISRTSSTRLDLAHMHYSRRAH